MSYIKIEFFHRTRAKPYIIYIRYFFDVPSYDILIIINRDQLFSSFKMKI